MRWVKLDRPKSHPCVTAELIDMMTAADPLSGFPASSDSLPDPLSQGERLLLHLSSFLMGSFSLLFINLARSPKHLWFWAWVAGWAVVLVLHLAVVLAVSRKRPTSGFPSYQPVTASKAGGQIGH